MILKVFYFFILLTGVLACTSGNRPERLVPPKPSTLSGQELAAIHCSSCHLFPAPDLLDKASWKNGVLPEMAYHLGIRPLTEKMGELDMDELRAVLQSGAYPDGPVLVGADWQKIVDYYLQQAPDKPLPQPSKAAIHLGLPFFEVRTLPATTTAPMISLVKIDAVNGRLLVGSCEKQQLEIYDQQLRKIDSLPLESPLSDLIWTDGNHYLSLEMGIIDPNDSRKGKLKRVDREKQSTLLLDSLRRPVQLTVQDLNQDNVPDYLICNYGHVSGLLAWYDGKTGRENVLVNLPGARLTRIADFNSDGRPDILALMAQARERISIFYNLGNGRFEESVMQEFPPVYGSSCLELADVNGDGHADIIYVNGDNADYSYSRKRYHGLRIFTNDGQNHFSEQYFYPIHGAGQVRAADFDADGDLDLAVTAFFTDPQQLPNEGFLFFENRGQLQFEVSTFAHAERGKWLVMDVGDLDRDGFPDIVLGSFMKSGLGQQTASAGQKPLSGVWLHNTGRRNRGR